MSNNLPIVAMLPLKSIDTAPRLSIRSVLWILTSDAVFVKLNQYSQLLRRKCCPLNYSIMIFMYVLRFFLGPGLLSACAISIILSDTVSVKQGQIRLTATSFVKVLGNHTKRDYVIVQLYWSKVALIEFLVVRTGVEGKAKSSILIVKQ